MAKSLAREPSQARAGASDLVIPQLILELVQYPLRTNYTLLMFISLMTICFPFSLDLTRIAFPKDPSPIFFIFTYFSIAGKAANIYHTDKMCVIGFLPNEAFRTNIQTPYFRPGRNGLTGGFVFNRLLI